MRDDTNAEPDTGEGTGDLHDLLSPVLRQGSSWVLGLLCRLSVLDQVQHAPVTGRICLTLAKH